MANKSDIENRVLCYLRRIIRAVDIYSRHLHSTIGLTGPQLMCLQSVVQKKKSTLTTLTKDVSLCGSTVTGIVDRLENKKLLIRERDTQDRRKIFLRPTPEGIKIVENAPPLLQGKLAEALAKLNKRQQSQIAESLEQIVIFMEAEQIEASQNLIPKPPMGIYEKGA